MRQSWKYKLLMFGLFTVAYGVMYVFPNLHPKWQPQFLPLLALDYWVPFLPWSFFIYMSDYILFLLVLIQLDDQESFNPFARMAFAVLLICGSFFIFYPTTYPRPLYPTVENPALQFVLNLISAADTPNNCFPSMHVSLTGIAAWSMRAKGPRWHFLFWVWSVAIFASTMTTKQHYFLDVLGGLCVIGTVVSLEWVLFEKRYLKTLVNRWPL
ncbi:MAG: phosphatase PAP2 family protein [Deltaproteobacteria bacterium]|nr:phosphatase PAP2 family protein [Deltaproteobacteria bacterium]